MKSSVKFPGALLCCFLLLFGPLLAAGQAPAAPDSSAGWEFRFEAYQRTSYLAREYGNYDYSLNPQVSYSATNGLYGTLEGLFFSPVQPAYVYTSLELGYAGQLGERWTYSFSGSRTFYNGRIDKREVVLRNCLEAFAQYELGPLALELDYNFLFDRLQAHSLGLTVSAPFEKNHCLGFDKVRFTPSAEVDWGSALTLLRFGSLTTSLGQSATNAANRSNLQLRPLAYEFSFPLEVQRGNVAFSFGGHLLVPIRLPAETPSPFAFGYLSAALILRLPPRE